MDIGLNEKHFEVLIHAAYVGFNTDRLEIERLCLYNGIDPKIVEETVVALETAGKVGGTITVRNRG